MIIKSIELSNFRNYEKLHIQFDKGTNILYGDNAQGKTNILEAAFLSGTTKSHKGSKDKEVIRFGQEESHIRTIVEKNEKEYQIDMHLRTRGSKGVAINKIPIKKASELFGILNIISATIILCREILVSGLREFLAEIKVGCPVTKLAKWKTTCQMIAIPVLMVSEPKFSGSWAAFWQYLGSFAFWGAAVLTVMTGYDYWRSGRKYMDD